MRFPAFIITLTHALEASLPKAGITPTVTVERVRGTRLYRVTVTAPEFEHLRHTERQDLVWRIAERAITPDEQLQISMIVTLSDAEVAPSRRRLAG